MRSVVQGASQHRPPANLYMRIRVDLGSASKVLLSSEEAAMPSVRNLCFALLTAGVSVDTGAESASTGDNALTRAWPSR